MSLHLSSDLDLPTEAVTQTFAILAKRGVGKSYSAMVMVEEMLKSNLRVVYVDPIGIAYGLRTSADGKNPGFPIAIAGGEHGDVPLESTNGEVIADLIVDNHLSMVIDLSLMRKGEQKRFMIDFAETLYHRNRTAMHLVLDEADEFAPQRAMGDEARLLGAIEDLVRRGRARGIGVTLITQRPAVLNKNVLTQIEVLVAMRLTSPQDRNAINEWVRYHADEDKSKEMILSLPSLPVGTAWFWSPGWLDIFKKVAIRKRETFDSSSTPEVGVKAIEEGKRAVVNIDYLREKLSETIQKAEENDPKKLRVRIRELELERKDKPEPITRVEQVAVIAQEQVQALVNAAHIIIKELEKHAAITVADTIDDLDHAFLVTEQGQSTPTGPVFNKPKEISPLRPSVNGDAIRLGPGEKKTLIAIGQFPSGTTRSYLTVLTGYKRSSRNTYISRLAQFGLVEVNGENIKITQKGIDTLGEDYDPLPTGSALRNRLLNELPPGEKSILSILLSAYPRAVIRDSLTERTGYARSSRNTYISRMIARNIIQVSGNEVRANDMLFEEDK